jgi:DNA-binding MarR family transcriptional regulator/GNAT superfamily N-acetyltransferase
MPKPSASIEAVRRFNRFYTREVGVLRKNFLDTPWSLGEMRVLFEIANGDAPTASDIGRQLDLDAAYLSRLLRSFETQGLISRSPSKIDARQSHLDLTAKGLAAFATADQRQIDKVKQMLGRLKAADQTRLVQAMATIETLLGENVEPKAQPVVRLRHPESGDLGWIVSRHAELYGEEYGWGGPFEAMCARIVADFGERFDPKWERGWIAEVDGERVGCVLLVKDKPGEERPRVARIRLLLLAPQARGLGLGRRLVDECVNFSRASGYKRITLWTHSDLIAARAIYAKTGFTLSGTELHESWGRPVTSEFWDMVL